MEQRQNLTSVNVHAVREKIGSKKELYDFLSQECNAYLPKFTCTNIYFLKSIISGEKNYLKRNEVVVSAVPQIEGLTAEDFIEHAQNHQNILNFLPDQCDWLHLDKKWICDVLMTLDSNGIQDKIMKAKEQRREKYDKKHDLLIQMRPEIANALHSSIQFSFRIKGQISLSFEAFFSKKKKLKELEEVKQEELLLSQSKQKYLEQNKRVRQEFSSLQEQVEELNDYKNLVMQLHQAGIINEDGNPLVVAPQFENQMQ